MSRPKLTLVVPVATHSIDQQSINNHSPINAANDTNQSYRVDNDSNIFINNKLNLYITPSGTQYHSPVTNNLNTAANQFSISDFQLLHVIGTGNSSTVYKAIHIQSQYHVAIKQMNIYDTNARHQLYKELYTLHSISNNTMNVSHMNNTLLSFYGCYYQSSILSLVLEYMDLGSMDSILSQLSFHYITDPSIISYIIRHILHSLYILRQQHQLHRDIKPHNILINSAGSIKLSDFGLTRELINDTVQQCNTYVGTLIYMAPERITGQKYSYSSDIWSVGLIIYLLAVGIHPYTQHNINSTNKNFCGGQIGLIQSIVNDDEPRLDNNIYDNDLCDALRKCLCKDPKQRYTAEQLLQHKFITKYQYCTTNEFKLWLQHNHIVSNAG